MSDSALHSEIEENILLTELGELLGVRTGLVFVQAQWIDLRRAIAVVATELAFTDWYTCLKLLVSSADSHHLQLLIDQLTVGETYFFRDGALFAALRERILPDLIQTRRDSGRYLRLWSAGCCSGEEPYSVAIELARMLPDVRDWNVTLLATDINQRFLQKAERGIYERWSFRDKAAATGSPYLLPRGNGRFEVAPLLRKLVRFAHLNLAVDCYPADITGTQSMDVILCRNVLMYLQPDCIKTVISRLNQCLSEGGWLITSTIEAALVDQPELKAIRLPDLVLFRKQSVAQSKLAPLQFEAEIKAPVEFVAARAAQQASEKTIAQAGDTQVRDVQALLGCARAFADQGMLEAAQGACESALAIDKMAVDANLLHANILLERGVNPGAEIALKRTLYLDSKCVVAYIALAALLSPQPLRGAEASRYWQIARTLLLGMSADEIVPASDGLTGRQMLDMVTTMLAAR
ncbi:MAG TPA: CheR family methyltransferase [Spongiibacteraceae bacterium]